MKFMRRHFYVLYCRLLLFVTFGWAWKPGKGMGLVTRVTWRPKNNCRATHHDVPIYKKTRLKNNLNKSEENSTLSAHTWKVVVLLNHPSLLWGDGEFVVSHECGCRRQRCGSSEHLLKERRLFVRFTQLMSVFVCLQWSCRVIVSLPLFTFQLHREALEEKNNGMEKQEYLEQDRLYQTKSSIFCRFCVSKFRFFYMESWRQERIGRPVKS